jgi:D-proline reductase (dithiol) PrdB
LSSATTPLSARGPSGFSYMANLSRKCVPFTPYDGDLSRANVAIVTAAGVHGRDQQPFDIGEDLGDLTYRVMDGEVTSTDLMVTHDHYDHTDADEDVNVVFPIDVLRELADEGIIGGLAKKHIGFMGYTMRLKDMYEQTAPAIADEIDKGSRADVVLLTGG